jgi:catechol 2,3-dioxygenase-like lactoylglutathione lyase family enzyme
MLVRRFIHVNVVCSDLERSLQFYVDILGAKVHELFDSGDSDLRPTMGVGEEGAPGYRAALVYWGDGRGGPYLDLLEWRGGDLAKRQWPLSAQDVGLARVALEVDDIDEWLGHLTAIGVDILGPVQEEIVGPWTLRLFLCRDPDGTLVELVSFPKGQRRNDHANSLTRAALQGARG